MSRYRFEPSSGVSGRYRDTLTGRFVPAATVRRELDRYLDASDDAARALARALRNREVSLADWELGMRRLIKNTHLNAVALERGGWANMTPADYGRAVCRRAIIVVSPRGVHILRCGRARPGPRI